LFRAERARPAAGLLVTRTGAGTLTTMATTDGIVLITGGTGFIGSYVARALRDRGRSVCLFDIRGLSAESRFVLGEGADEVPVELGSIEDWPRLLEVVRRRRPAQVVHIGGIVDPLFLLKNPATALRVNVEGTVNVLEVARAFDVARVVFFSSIGVLPAVQYQPIDAAHPVILPRGGPASGAYGAAKLSGEAFCFAYHQAFGLDVRIIRPSAAYGFGMQWHSANYMKQFVEPAVRGEVVRLASGGPLPRDYTHVQDIAGLTVAVLDGPADADRVFYAATGQPLVTAAEAARIVRELVSGSEIAIADVLSEDDQVELGFRGVLSIENARRQLGWEPRYRSLRDGIGEYIGRYRAFLAAAAR
jgi:nucleoside-diphosphate-sugar epimerase